MSSDRPMSAEEAAAYFNDVEGQRGRAVRILEEAKTDIETIALMVDAAGAKSLRRNKALEFAKGFNLHEFPGVVDDIEMLLYGDVEARVEAGRRVWKICDQLSKKVPDGD